MGVPAQAADVGAGLVGDDAGDDQRLSGGRIEGDALVALDEHPAAGDPGRSGRRCRRRRRSPRRCSASRLDDQRRALLDEDVAAPAQPTAAAAVEDSTRRRSR